MSFFNFIGSYDDAWKAIVMPPRQDYSIYDLGPNDINIRGKRIQRADFRLLNKRGQTLECSFFQQTNVDTAIPCVIYLHANGCSRLEALQYLDTVLSNDMNLFCFDFSGCGKSGGVYTSLGWFEQEDLECAIQYLTNTGKVSKIAVWGRSMGAITAILYAVKDPRIACYIFDSPFSKFKQLVKELAKEKASLPGFLSEGAFSIIRQTIKKKVNFDIDDLRPLKYVDKINVPALFGAARSDTFVLPQHTSDLYSAYLGPKQMMIFEGDHNSQRPSNWTTLVKEFLDTHLLKEPVRADPNPKSLKQLFDPMIEKPSISSSDALGSLEIKKPSISDKIFSKQPPQQPRHQVQKSHSMNFTWLEHSASSPDLQSTLSLQSLGLSEKDLKGHGSNLELVSSTSQPKPKPQPEKPAEKRFGELFGEKHKAEVTPQQQRPAPSQSLSHTQTQNQSHIQTQSQSQSQSQSQNHSQSQKTYTIETKQQQQNPPTQNAPTPTQKTYTLDLSQKGPKQFSRGAQSSTQAQVGVQGQSKSHQHHPASSSHNHLHDMKRPHQSHQPQLPSKPQHQTQVQGNEMMKKHTTSTANTVHTEEGAKQGRTIRDGISPKNLPNKPLNHPITYAQSIPHTNPQPHPHGLAKSHQQQQPAVQGNSSMSTHHNTQSMMNLHHLPSNSTMNSNRSVAGPSQVLQNKLTRGSGNPGSQSSSSISIFGPKQVRARNEDIVHQHPINPALKDASMYRLNSAIGFGVETENQKQSRPEKTPNTSTNTSSYQQKDYQNSYLNGSSYAQAKQQYPVNPAGHHVRDKPSISIDENQQNSQYLPKKPQILQSRNQPGSDKIFYTPSHVGQAGHMTQYLAQAQATGNMRQPDLRRNTDNLIQPLNNSITKGGIEYNPNKSCHEMDNINLSTNLLSHSQSQYQPKNVKTLTVDLSQASTMYGQHKGYPIIK